MEMLFLANLSARSDKTKPNKEKKTNIKIYNNLD